MLHNTSNGSVKNQPENISGWLIHFCDMIRKSIYYISATIILASFSSMFLAILANVILRYLFDKGITWAYELPQLLFPWSVAAGMVLTSTLKRNISVDSLVQVLTPLVQRLILIFVNFAVGATCIGVVYFSIPIIKAAKYTKLAETGIPQIYGYSSLLYAFGLISIISIINILEYLLLSKDLSRSPENNNYS